MLMIKSFEAAYKELEELFIKKLPDYIEKINKEHNDGIIFKSFGNTTLTESCIKTPSFAFSIEESEYSEKDRIIENTLFTVSFELKLPPEMKQKSIIFWRYVEAIQRLLEETESEYLYEIIRIMETKIIIKITLCR